MSTISPLDRFDRSRNEAFSHPVSPARVRDHGLRAAVPISLRSVALTALFGALAGLAWAAVAAR